MQLSQKIYSAECYIILFPINMNVVLYYHHILIVKQMRLTK